MTQFILNNTEIKTTLSPGMTMLDFVRYNQHLTGTKIGCREGDCGACTMLIGTLTDGRMKYHAVTSCLMPIGNAHGKHVVTIEGINLKELTLVQESFAQFGATQCGFCTPGFIVSLTGYCLDEKSPSSEKAIDAVNGNICRCTGYKSIEKAAYSVSEKLASRQGVDAISFAVKNNIVPEYFLKIPGKIKLIQANPHVVSTNDTIDFLLDQDYLKGITQVGNACEMGASTTVAEMSDDPILNLIFKNLQKYFKLVSSLPIRNMATVAGNFTNASPIGDLTIMFLALDAQLELSDDQQKRNIALRDFYKGYKQLDKNSNEIIEKIRFELPATTDFFNFEKVSKRTHLDIASVNSAILLQMNGDVIEKAGLSAGGVGPIPKYLSRSSAFLKGKSVTEKLIMELIELVQEEISPISDARGTEQYKRLLLSQLIKAHFIEFFPLLKKEVLLSNGLIGQ